MDKPQECKIIQQSNIQVSKETEVKTDTSENHEPSTMEEEGKTDQNASEVDCTFNEVPDFCAQDEMCISIARSLISQAVESINESEKMAEESTEAEPSQAKPPKKSSKKKKGKKKQESASSKAQPSETLNHSTKAFSLENGDQCSTTSQEQKSSKKNNEQSQTIHSTDGKVGDGTKKKRIRKKALAKLNQEAENAKNKDVLTSSNEQSQRTSLDDNKFNEVLTPEDKYDITTTDDSSKPLSINEDNFKHEENCLTPTPTLSDLSEDERYREVLNSDSIYMLITKLNQTIQFNEDKVGIKSPEDSLSNSMCVLSKSNPAPITKSDANEGFKKSDTRESKQPQETPENDGFIEVKPNKKKNQKEPKKEESGRFHRNHRERQEKVAKQQTQNEGNRQYQSRNSDQAKPTGLNREGTESKSAITYELKKTSTNNTVSEKSKANASSSGAESKKIDLKISKNESMPVESQESNKLSALESQLALKHEHSAPCGNDQSAASTGVRIRKPLRLNPKAIPLSFSVLSPEEILRQHIQKIVDQLYFEKLEQDIFYSVKKVTKESNEIMHLRKIAYERINYVITHCFESNSYCLAIPKYHLQIIDFKTRLFGSCTTGFALKSSDVDIAIYSPDALGKLDAVALLQAAEEKLSCFRWIKSVKPIYQAKIPVLKLVIPSYYSI